MQRSAHCAAGVATIVTVAQANKKKAQNGSIKQNKSKNNNQPVWHGMNAFCLHHSIDWGEAKRVKKHKIKNQKPKNKIRKLGL